MAHVTHSIQPVVMVRFDAGEYFPIESNYTERTLMAHSLKLGQDYADKLIVMLEGYGVKKDGTPSQYRYQRQLKVSDILAGNVSELNKITLAFLQRVTISAVARWNRLGDYIQAYSAGTGEPLTDPLVIHDTRLLAVSGAVLRVND